jgi:hypothetical protein
MIQDGLLLSNHSPPPAVIPAMSNEQSGGMRRRSGQQPRSQVVTVKLSAEEKAMLQAAAERRVLSLGAFVAETSLAAAANRTVPVGDVEREILRELIRISGQLYGCQARLAEAGGRLETAGIPRPDLEPAVADLRKSCDSVDDAMLMVSRLLRPRRRRLPRRATQGGADNW